MGKKKKVDFSEVMGWIVGFIGGLTAIISWFYIEKSKFYLIFTGILLVSEIVIIVIWGWALVEKYKQEKEITMLCEKIQDLESQSEGLKHTINELNKNSENQHEKMMKKIAVISLNMKNVSKLNNEFCNRIPEITENSYHMLEVFSENGFKDIKTYEKELQHSYKELEKGLIDVFRRYSSNLLNYLVAVEEAYLSCKGWDLTVSASIKLFDAPYLSEYDNRNEIGVYTAFRDGHTYEQHRREIGEERYTIDGNVDFAHCLRKDHYIINNVKGDSPNYMNEHKDFDRYYNCAIVVAVRTKLYGNNFKHYGYLCCDCLNVQGADDIFDNQSAYLLFAIAKQYAMFLETLDANWSDRIGRLSSQPKDILALIYKHTYTGK